MPALKGWFTHTTQAQAQSKHKPRVNRRKHKENERELGVAEDKLGYRQPTLETSAAVTFAASITLINTQLIQQFVSRRADAVNLVLYDAGITRNCH